MTIRHGFLSQQDADNISESMERSLDNTRRLNGLQPMTIEIIPAKITGGASGVHAWTRQTIDATGGRVDDPAAFTGLVSGVSSATVTFQPARMPDGSTLGSYPTYGYVQPIGITPSTGMNYEIMVVGGSSPGITSSSTIATQFTISAAVDTYQYTNIDVSFADLPVGDYVVHSRISSSVSLSSGSGSSTYVTTFLRWVESDSSLELNASGGSENSVIGVQGPDVSSAGTITYWHSAQWSTTVRVLSVSSTHKLKLFAKRNTALTHIVGYTGVANDWFVIYRLK